MNRKKIYLLFGVLAVLAIVIFSAGQLMIENNVGNLSVSFGSSVSPSGSASPNPSPSSSPFASLCCQESSFGWNAHLVRYDCYDIDNQSEINSCRTTGWSLWKTERSIMANKKCVYGMNNGYWFGFCQ